MEQLWGVLWPHTQLMSLFLAQATMRAAHLQSLCVLKNLKVSWELSMLRCATVQDSRVFCGCQYLTGPYTTEQLMSGGTLQSTLADGPSSGGLRCCRPAVTLSRSQTISRLALSALSYNPVCVMSDPRAACVLLCWGHDLHLTCPARLLCFCFCTGL